jgi:hypothetical protein
MNRLVFSKRCASAIENHPMPPKAVSAPHFDGTLVDNQLAVYSVLLEDFHMNIELASRVNAVCSEQWLTSTEAAKLLCPSTHT